MEGWKSNGWLDVWMDGWIQPGGGLKLFGLEHLCVREQAET